MVKQAQIDRGKKWTEVRAKAVFENNSKDVDWIDSQASIQEDIAAYSNSAIPVKETKEKK